MIKFLKQLFCKHEYKYLFSYHFLSANNEFSGYGSLFITMDREFAEKHSKQTLDLIKSKIDSKVMDPNIVILSIFKL